MRFPGFEGEWEANKIGNIATNKSQKFNPSKANEYVKCVELEHISANMGELLGFIDGSQSGSIKNVFNKGDVLFGKLRPYLRKYIYAPFDGVCSSEIWVLKGKSITNAFLYQIVQTDKFIDLANQSSGSKMPRADWNVVQNAKIFFPSQNEQEKISNFLEIINERITTQIKIIEELKLLKRNVSTKIFTQQWKFKNDNGNNFPNWTLSKLSDICSIKMGQSPSSSSYNTDRKGLPLIQGNADIVNGFTAPRNWTSEPTKECEIGNLILTVRAPVGLVAKSIHNACIGRGVSAISSILNNSIEFIYQFLLFFEDKWTSIEQGSTFTAVSGDEIKHIKLAVPCFEEQNIIANFLSSLDDKIQIEQLLFKKLTQQRQFLLSNLFI